MFEIAETFTVKETPVITFDVVDNSEVSFYADNKYYNINPSYITNSIMCKPYRDNSGEWVTPEIEDLMSEKVKQFIIDNRDKWIETELPEGVNI